MTKPHATNPGVVRERRQKAAIERRAEKRADPVLERMMAAHAETVHGLTLVPIRWGHDQRGQCALCEICWGKAPA